MLRPTLRHGHLAHRYLSGIPTWRRGLLSGLRHGHLAHRYLSGIPAWRRGSSKRPLARTPCPQVPQWHPRVAKGSSNRHFGTDTLPTDISVASRRGKGGLLSGLWHGHPAHKYLSGIPAWRRGLLSGLRHGHPAHRYLSGIPTWRRGLLSGLRHGHPAHRYLSGIPTWRRGCV